jgi:hypothetical protein
LNGKATLVLSDQWLPKQSSIEKVAAEDKILSKYLRCYGPATQQDFSAWSGLSMTTVKEIWKRNNPNLVEVLFNKKPHWILQQDQKTLLDTQGASHPLRLLPHFDIFLLGHKDKGHIVDEAHYKRVFKKAAWIAPVLLCDGRVIGTWKQKRTTKKITVIVEPFNTLAKSHLHDVETEAQYLGKYYDLAPEVKVTS